MDLPLDKQLLSDSNIVPTKTFPAIHTHWCSNKKFFLYERPPISGLDGLQEWIEITEHLIEDLTILLNSTYQKFWVEIIFNESLSRLIDSFLKQAPRPYEEHHFNVKIDTLHNNLYKLIFLICLRFSVHKESKDSIKPEVFGEILYENFIWDISKLLDFCSIYYPANKIVQQTVQNIFKYQPKYELDLKNSLPGILRIFDIITDKINGTKKSQNAELSEKEIESVILNILDLSKTIESFVKCYQNSNIFHELNLHFKIATFYNNVMSNMTDQLSEQNNDELVLLLSIARLSFIDIFRLIFNECCVKKLDNQKNNASIARQVLDTYRNILELHSFAVDYSVIYDFTIDMPVLWPFVGNVIHETEITYIQSAFETLKPINDGVNHITKNIEKNDGAAGIDMDGFIKSVKEVLPDIDDCIIKEQLEIFDFNVERVIQSILEGNINSYTEKHNGLVDPKPETISRVNVFDGDEFDVFNRGDVNLDNVHMGKKTYQLPELENDKEAFKSTKNLAYMLEVESDNEYDDEYDDTYDAHVVGAQDNDSADEILMDRKCEIPRVLLPKPDKKFHVVEDSEDEETEKKRNINFCEDPAKVRERYAERKASQTVARGGYKGKHFVNNYQSSSSNAPSGSGSNNNDARQRQKKEQHKSSKANHNRRILADKKRKV